MEVIFYCSRGESDEYEFPDNTSVTELKAMAEQWVADNVHGECEVINEFEKNYEVYNENNW